MGIGITILQLSKLKLRKLNKLAQNHATKMWNSFDSKPGISQTLEPMTPLSMSSAPGSSPASLAFIQSYSIIVWGGEEPWCSPDCNNRYHLLSSYCVTEIVLGCFTYVILNSHINNVKWLHSYVSCSPQIQISLNYKFFIILMLIPHYPSLPFPPWVNH